MKIDKEKLQQLAGLTDKELWAHIRGIAAAKGFNLPEKEPPHAELEKVRAAMLSDKINLGNALRVINNYRKGQS